ncbi:hypothetical protein CPB83DRAFT_805916 [Crepidotus variabilis]|uniref:Queuosine 5'-phosphate N-glycosylase/hydrolase n=1 Tax=Crepidotus variabilis TaxID=179855 RepID=A0A9P6JUR1_9AGAR|nr:hypothetical protein CPB83DRAFT_805916 [Crepidotus variabilis]
MLLSVESIVDTALSEKNDDWEVENDLRNPVIDSSEFAYRATNLVQIQDEGVKLAAKHIHQRMLVESYTPRTWRTHPLHICPSEPYDSADPLNTTVLNWIFLISSLNFSFWSEKAGQPECYGVNWRTSWTSRQTEVHTGYWALVAALDRALDEEIPITDANFYSSETLCPDSLIQHVFREADQCDESIPLFEDRVSIMRENGFILCNSFGGSFKGFVDEFHRRFSGQGTALDLVKMVTDTFPLFRDEIFYEGRKVAIWKRAQILVAEIWAAFYPASPDVPHPIFPGLKGPEIHRLTMFADYRVPQILHHLRIISYPQSLLDLLHSGSPLASGSREEVSLRCSSIIAVEHVKEEILRLVDEEGGDSAAALKSGTVCSVLIDFYLWDLAKKIELGEEKVDGIDTAQLVPVHRTRSIWY